MPLTDTFDPQSLAWQQLKAQQEQLLRQQREVANALAFSEIEMSIAQVRAGLVTVQEFFNFAVDRALQHGPALKPGDTCRIQDLKITAETAEQFQKRLVASFDTSAPGGHCKGAESAPANAAREDSD